VGLLDQLEQRLFSSVLEKLKTWLGPLGKAFDLITHFWKTVKDAWHKSIELAGLIKDEIAAWKNFREDIAFRTGVVSLPAAIRQTQELVSVVIDGWHAIVDLATEAKSQLDAVGFEDPAAEAKAAVEEIRTGKGFRAILEKFPKLAKGLEKVLAWLGFLVQLATLWITLADDLTAIVEAIAAIRDEVEHGSTVFLQQKNPRRNDRLEDGTPIKLRVGNIH
jgi:hypothetical protein